jgi:hypothetical protein
MNDKELINIHEIIDELFEQLIVDIRYIYKNKYHMDPPSEEDVEKAFYLYIKELIEAKQL